MYLLLKGYPPCKSTGDLENHPVKRSYRTLISKLVFSLRRIRQKLVSFGILKEFRALINSAGSDAFTGTPSKDENFREAREFYEVFDAKIFSKIHPSAPRPVQPPYMIY